MCLQWMLLLSYIHFLTWLNLHLTETKCIIVIFSVSLEGKKNSIS